MIFSFIAVLLVGYGVLMCKIFGVVCDCNSGCDGGGDDDDSDDLLLVMAW